MGKIQLCQACHGRFNFFSGLTGRQHRGLLGTLEVARQVRGAIQVS